MGKFLQGFKGMRQDLNETNMSPEYYYYAKNLTTSVTDDISNIGGIGNIKSDKLIKALDNDDPVLGPVVKVLGGIEIDSYRVVIFTHNVRNGLVDFNVIYLIDYSDENDITIESIYKPIFLNPEYEEGFWGVTERITILHNKENEVVNKIYWIDGEHQVRSLNIAPVINEEVDYLTTPIDLLDATSKVEFSSIEINESSGPIFSGIHTSGQIQYAYAYFNRSGQSTGVSPLSELVPLTKADGQGGDVNQIVGQSNYVKISEIDTNYDFVRLYGIKYNTHTEEPVISLIQERILESTDSSIEFLDNGTVINSISTEEFLFLGSDIYYPKAFEIKDDRMFIANFEEDNWDIEPDDFDCRAYRFKTAGTAGIVDEDGGTPIEFTYNELITDTVVIPDTHNCIPSNHAAQLYQGDYTTYGASGKHMSINVIEEDLDLNHSTPYYRGGELYRLGVIFINSYGKKSTPQWICDYQMPSLNKMYSLEVNFDDAGLDLETLDIVGFMGCRVDRTNNDKFVLHSGLVSSCMFKFVTNQDDTAGLADLFDEAIDGSTGHSDGYLARENVLNNAIIYPNYLYNTGLEDRDLSFNYNRTSSLNNYSLLTGDQYPTNLVGQPIDRGEYVLNSAVDSKINYGITYLDSGASNTKLSLTFQNTKVWNIYSPDITFGNTDTTNISKKVRINNSFALAVWDDSLDYTLYSEAYDPVTGRLKDSESTISTSYAGLSSVFLDNLSYGTEDISGESYSYKFKFNHNYSINGKSYVKYMNSNPDDEVYAIYGSPLYMEQGSNATAYNNNNNLIISNNVYDFTNDIWQESSQHTCLGINSVYNKNVFIIPFKDNIVGDQASQRNHKRLEEAIESFKGASAYDPIFTIVDVMTDFYYSTIYGGDTYEARTRNSYLVYGGYTEIEVSSTADMSGTGDTYYRNWSFARSSEGEIEDTTGKYPTIIENISIPVETYLDLDKRNDLTANTDGDISNIKFKTFDELHRYNTVYNRGPNAVSYTPSSYLENNVNLFPNLIRASKQKIPGEIIDSFTDILVNEETNLNSRYGPINKLKLFKDSLYVFQENAIAYQSINPRAQIIADDGLSVELGTGSLFGKDKYLTTESGILYKDRFSVIEGNSSVYYVDRMNYSVVSVSGSQMLGLSNTKFNSKLIRNTLHKDSDLEILCGFDFIRDNLFISLPIDSISENELTTIIYNELFSEFISIRSMNPDNLIQSRNGLFGFNRSLGLLDPSTLYLIEQGDSYNNMLGDDLDDIDDKEPLLTILAKPKEYGSARYDSLELKSINRGFSNNPNVLNKIRAYNEEQDSGIVSVLPRNKFDMWRLNLPRGNNKKVGNRFNGRWLYLDMYMNNNDSINSQFNIYNLGVNYGNKV